MHHIVLHPHFFITYACTICVEYSHRIALVSTRIHNIVDNYVRQVQHKVIAISLIYFDKINVQKSNIDGKNDVRMLEN